MILIACVVALGGCAGFAKAVGGSNTVHMDGKKIVVVRVYGDDGNGNRVILSEKTTTTKGLVTGETLAGFGRGVKGVANGSVRYDASTGVLHIDFDENAEIDGNVGADLFRLIAEGASAYRDVKVAEAKGDGAAVEEALETFDARLLAIEESIQRLADAQEDDIVDEASLRERNLAETERIQAIVKASNFFDAERK